MVRPPGTSRLSPGTGQHRGHGPGDNGADNQVVAAHTLAIHQHVDTTITAYNIQPHHTFTSSPLAIGDDEWSNIVVIVPI